MKNNLYSLSQEFLEPNLRALHVLQTNNYFVLSTIDKRGPWAAALAYMSALPQDLYFISQRRSRHARAIGRDDRVSGVIFDSMASLENTESIQFQGTCSKTLKDKLIVRSLLEQSARKHNEALSVESIEALMSDHNAQIFRVIISEAYVLDQRAWKERHVDARQFIDIAAVFRKLPAESYLSLGRGSP